MIGGRVLCVAKNSDDCLIWKGADYFIRCTVWSSTDVGKGLICIADHFVTLLYLNNHWFLRRCLIFNQWDGLRVVLTHVTIATCGIFFTLDSGSLHVVCVVGSVFKREQRSLSSFHAAQRGVNFAQTRRCRNQN